MVLLYLCQKYSFGMRNVPRRLAKMIAERELNKYAGRMSV